MEDRTAALIEALGALESERERLAYALESSGIAMWDLDVETGVILFSVEWARMLGDPIREIRSTVQEELARVPRDERAALSEVVFRVVKGEVPQYDQVHRVRRPDGAILWIHSRGRVTRRSSEGRALRMNGTNSDVTRRVLDEGRVRDREEQLRLVTDNVPVMINLLDADFRVLFANRPYLEFLGVEREAVLGRTLGEVAGREAEEVARSFLPRLRAGERIVHERARADATGRTRHFEVRLIPRIDASLGFTGHFSLIDDVTERRETSLRLALAAQHLRLLTDGVDSLIAHFDLDAKLLFANRRYREYFGISEESIPGLPARAFAGGEAMALLLSHMAGVRRGESVVYDVVRTRGQLSSEFEVRLEPQHGASGEVEGVYVVLNDITARKALERGLALQAFMDPVTTLPNRRLLIDRVNVAIARAKRDGTRLAIVFVDLDGFKAVNDRFGHDAGDELLRGAGERFGRCVRESDTVARVGGDEFVVLLDPLREDADAGRVAAKLLAALQAPFALVDATAGVGASMGIAVYPSDGEGADSLLRAADTAMYRAKSLGKGRWFRAGAETAGCEPSSTEPRRDAVTPAR